MASWPKIFYLLILLVVMVTLSGCELTRAGDANADLRPMSELPPTLAPLGAEDAALAAEATPVPTIINVQPTATPSQLGEGDAAVNPEELVAPTSQPASLPAEPAADSSEATQAEVAPEAYAAPTEEPVSEATGAEAPVEEEPIIVDAPALDAPDAGPVAANPPASQTEGSYSTSSFSDNSYTIQAGDTLFNISQRYGTTVEAIMAVNGLNSDLVYVGQTLTIPADDGSSYTAPVDIPAAPGGDGNYHVVAPGETLFRIAQNYGVSVEAIAGANNIAYPYIIYPGQPLLLPAYGDSPQLPVPPVENFYPPQAGENYPTPGDIAGTHTVAPGETLFSIAQRYGVTAEMIALANGLANPNQIYVGQVLYLP